MAKKRRKVELGESAKEAAKDLRRDLGGRKPSKVVDQAVCLMDHIPWTTGELYEEIPRQWFDAQANEDDMVGAVCAVGYVNMAVAKSADPHHGEGDYSVARDLVVAAGLPGEENWLVSFNDRQSHMSPESYQKGKAAVKARLQALSSRLKARGL